MLYTPGHTDNSYSFLMGDRVFTGDTLLIRGTGRTDFQNGEPARAIRVALRQAAEAAGGDAGLSRPRLQGRHRLHHRRGEALQSAPAGRNRSTSTSTLMGKPQPAQSEDDGRGRARQHARQGLRRRRSRAGLGGDGRRGEWRCSGDRTSRWSTCARRREREKHGVIPGSLHAPYPDLQENIGAGGMLHELAAQRASAWCSTAPSANARPWRCRRRRTRASPPPATSRAASTPGRRPAARRVDLAEGLRPARQDLRPDPDHLRSTRHGDLDPLRRAAEERHQEQRALRVRGLRSRRNLQNVAAFNGNMLAFLNRDAA